MFGLRRVENVLNQCVEDGVMSPKDILDAMTMEVHRFVKNAEQSDDLTLMAIRFS
jgi:serine phosphatase RsbU (regulator of sigma subunit)